MTGAPTIGFFERTLTVWVALCIVAGVAPRAGAAWQPSTPSAALEVAKVNLPVGLLIWIMIIPMLLKIDFTALGQVEVSLARNRRHAVHQLGGQAVLDGPARVDLHPPRVLGRWLPAAQLDSYVAGLILLAAAPCTAMVFVWSPADARATRTSRCRQVALNDAIMVLAFAPIVATAARALVHHGALGHVADVGRRCTSSFRCCCRAAWRRRSACQRAWRTCQAVTQQARAAVDRSAAC